MVTSFFAMGLDIWLISVDQEEIRFIRKEMVYAITVINLAILQDSVEVKTMEEKVQ